MFLIIFFVIIFEKPYLRKDKVEKKIWRNGFVIWKRRSVRRLTKEKVQSQYFSKVPYAKSGQDGEYFRTISRHSAIVVQPSIVKVCCVGHMQITPSTVHTLSMTFVGISLPKYMRISCRVALNLFAHYMTSRSV